MNMCNQLSTNQTKMLLIMVFSVLTLVTNQSYSQEFKKNKATQLLKEDPNNDVRPAAISNLDLIRALEIAGIRIYKFNLGQFDKTYNMSILFDEYVNGKIIKTDTMALQNNLYHYYESGSENYFLDYIDQLKIFTKDEENKTTLYFETYDMGFQKELSYVRTDKEQFYTWRKYLTTLWKLNKKIPILVYASSWFDKEIGFHRFCGATNLSDNDPQTIELLSLSPHYYMVSYVVTEIKE